MVIIKSSIFILLLTVSTTFSQERTILPSLNTINAIANALTQSGGFPSSDFLNILSSGGNAQIQQTLVNLIAGLLGNFTQTLRPPSQSNETQTRLSFAQAPIQTLPFPTLNATELATLFENFSQLVNSGQTGGDSDEPSVPPTTRLLGNGTNADLNFLSLAQLFSMIGR